MKRFLIILTIALLSSSAVFLLGLATADKAKYNNDFTRLFPPHGADLVKTMKVEPGQFNLAGLAGDKFFLYNRSGVLVIGASKTDSTWIPFKITVGSELVIDSPYFFMHNGSEQKLQRGLLECFETDTSFIGLERFTAIQPISPSNAIQRTMNVSERKNIISDLTERHTYTLEKQVDGLLCTDGFMQYSKEYQLLVYLFRYRNQFITFDTSLRPVRSGKTIDTTSVAKISISELDGKITMAKPPLMVNKGMSVDKKFLYVYSNLMAKNESEERFKNNHVIDVYNILDGTYRFSFYINKYDESSIQELYVKGPLVAVMFKGSLAIYEIPLVYLK